MISTTLKSVNHFNTFATAIITIFHSYRMASHLCGNFFYSELPPHICNAGGLVKYCNVNNSITCKYRSRLKTLSIHSSLYGYPMLMCGSGSVDLTNTEVKRKLDSELLPYSMTQIWNIMGR